MKIKKELKYDTISTRSYQFFNNLRNYTTETLIELYEEWITGQFVYKGVDNCLPKPPALSELKGKNLACFCPEGSSCHADVLLKLANHEID